MNQSFFDNIKNNNTFSQYNQVKEMSDQEAVLNAMMEIGKPVRPGDVAKKLGIESKVVSKAIQKLKKEGKVHSPKRCYWAPTEE